MTDEFAHYGTPRKSGRYPWGSGEDPKQNSRDFLGYEEQLRKSGLSEKEVADAFGMSISALRNKKSIAKNEQHAASVAQIVRMKDKGMSNVAIGKQLNMPEATVRSLLDPSRQARVTVLDSTAKMLRESVTKDAFIDIGPGIEYHLPGVSNGAVRKAVAKLEEEGYVKAYVKVPQLGVPGQFTTRTILAPPGTTWKDINENPHKITLPFKYSEDGGRSYTSIEPIKNVSPKRISIRYKEDGGADMDGVIELRRGVDDISLAGNRYAQVRIGVDGTHYIKGMALYADDLPAGVDIRFNTNKSNTGNKLDALKELKADPTNPFGSIVKQQHYTDAAGKKHLSALNLVNVEGDWDKWSKSLSSQVLSKQAPSLAKQQLDKALSHKQKEFDEIMALTNPTIKKKLLASFADDCDSAAVHLKAAAMPRQRTQVLLPVKGVKETEVFAPNFKNGEKVVLIRHPHGGPFEIPELTVNNRNPNAKAVLGGAIDAVGIHPKVAGRLSGADFDGDTVLVIPNPSVRGIRTAPALSGLKDFDPQRSYPYYEGMKVMSAKHKGRAMGDISNLITDMTIQGANEGELARAVRHSMVVIDAEKHKLNYKQSAVDNGIAALKTRYQGGPRAGASTLISLAKADARVPEIKPRKAQDGGPIDPLTGKKMYTPTGDTYPKTTVNKRTGEVKTVTVAKTTKTTRMAITEDARTLSRGTIIEGVYASHANNLKGLGNAARKAYLNTGLLKYSDTAAKTYAPEVKTLKAKLAIALSAAPLERQAQTIANTKANAKISANPQYDDDDIKKVRTMELAAARAYTGSAKQRVVIMPREWEAVQAGAIHDNTLQKILANTEVDKIKEYATPRTTVGISASQAARARSMSRGGATSAEIAEALGIGVSSVLETLK